MSGGIVTVSVFGVFFFLYKAVSTLINYILWAKKGNRFTGRIIDLTKTINAYSKHKSQSTKYTYEIEIDGEKNHVKLIEFTSKDKPSKYDVDNYIDIFYRQDTGEVASIEILKNECFEYFLMIFVCIGIILLCFYISVYVL